MKKPVVHLYIQGACGNQFFQYAFARYLQTQMDAELIINYHFVRANKNLWAGSDDLLRDFNVTEYKYEKNLGFGGTIFVLLRWFRNLFRLKDFRPKTYEFMVKHADLFVKHGIYYFDAAYYPFKISQKQNIYIWGYYESPKYFESIRDAICNELQPLKPLLANNTDMYSRIQNTESVCITIKRQDIENKKITDIYTYSIDYFIRGIEIIKEKVESPVFFVFADDVEWCRNNIHIDGEVYFENEGNPIYEKIRLMSSCKHFIIHNSTFSWWVQYLAQNPEKIVIAPSRWMQRDDQPIDIYEDNWLFLTDKGEIIEKHE